MDDNGTVEVWPGHRNYGWCGLCHSFTHFPHDCPGEAVQVDEAA